MMYAKRIKHIAIVYVNIIFESLKLAWQSIKINKLRAILTLFGLSIGIFSIVAVFSAVDTLEKGIRENISTLGADVVYIQKWPWTFESDYKWWEYIKRPTPKYSEYEAISRKVNSADIVGFSVSTMRPVRYKNKVYEKGGIWANTYDFIKLRNFEIEKGRYFSMHEDKSGRNLCLLGANVAKYLFENENPINKYIFIEGHKVKVIGVLKKEGVGLVGGSVDDLVLLTVQYARNIFDIRSDNLNPYVIVKAKEGIELSLMIEEIRSVLRKLHGLKPEQKDDFSINQSSMLISGVNQIFKVIHIAGWIIGGFALLVGGFGIANIMFVSVKERTGQIGIQKAIGAKNIFILLQFMFEGIILAIAGGLIGIIMVVFMLSFTNIMFNFPINFSINNFLFGVAVSSVVGVLAAIWPAYTAARLNPVEAINTNF